MNLLLSILGGCNLCQLNVGSCLITAKRAKLHFLLENDKGPSLTPDFFVHFGRVYYYFVKLVLMNLLLSILGGFNFCQLNVGSCLREGPSLKLDVVSTFFVNLVLMNLLLSKVRFGPRLA